MASLQLLLHAHLPFIRHPEHGSFLEENWLFEAMAESYTPLLQMLNRLDEAGIKPHITISFSASLLSMLNDELLKERYVRYLRRLIELGEKEVKRTLHDSVFAPLAKMYRDMYQSSFEFFTERVNCDILSGFDYHQKKGNIELITSPGTYPFLPFYQQYPANIHAHLEAALNLYCKTFNKGTSGIWLPECGYFPGLEEILKDHGIKFFYVAAYGILFAENSPCAGTYAPVKTNNGVYVFPRDVASVKRVWSEIDGYPGELAYRDFYRDIGHDLDYEYIKPYIHSEEFRINTGYKYYAITGLTDQKKPYRPEVAKAKLGEHADNFIFTLQNRFRKVEPLMDGEALVTTAFSAELFGHWWFEGVQWLENVIRKIDANNKNGVPDASLVTPSSFIQEHPKQQILDPVFSSWGNKGYAEVWLCGENDWIYRHLHSAIEHMQELVDRFPEVSGLKKCALNQAAREVLLAQTLDWAVIMRSGVSKEYAKARIREHVGNFYYIYEALSQGNLSTAWLIKIEKKNNIFPDIDYRTFAARIKREHGRMGHPYAVTDKLMK